jgi:hypothetical protein
MTPPPLSVWFWGLFAVALATYLLLAIVRQNVSLRPVRLGWFAAAAVVGRAMLLPTSSIELWEWLPLGACAAAATVAPCAARIWLVRISPDEFRQRLDDACRGLRLELRQSSPDCVELVERQQVHSLRMTALSKGRILIHLPRATRPSKVALLVDWLSKQYPGPVPRIHVDRSRES